MTPRAAAALHFGTSSWSAKSWVGSFYPEGMAAADFLSAYSKVFSSVEADVTYYRIPSRDMVDGWKRRTPPEFVLSAKMPRSIVHAGEAAAPNPERLLVLDEVLRDSDRFLEVMGRMQPKLGPLVLQFPYFNRECFAESGPFMERLGAYLERLPVELRFAVEIRNKAWVTPDFLELLRGHGVGFVLLDLAYMPHPDEFPDDLDLITADFVYTRLIGDRKRIDALTDRFDRVVLDQGERLERWGSVLRDVAGDAPELFVYANNHYAGHGPATAAHIEALVRGTTPPAAPRVPRSGELPF